MALRVGSKKKDDKEEKGKKKEDKKDAPSKDKADSAPKASAPPSDPTPMDMSGDADLPTDMPEAAPIAPEEMGMAPEAMEHSAPLDPRIAGYKTPDQGPFMCANCAYFRQDVPNACSVVAGIIDEEGICNVFMPMNYEQEEMPMEGAPEEQALPEEAPMPEEEPPAM